MARRDLRPRHREGAAPLGSFPIVSPEDLLLSKLEWASDSHSDFQLRDVRSLIASVPGLDWAYIDRWAVELGVAALLAEVRT